MISGLERAIERLGTEMTVEYGDESINGRGIIYPLRFRQHWGETAHTQAGRTDPGRFILFCSRELSAFIGTGSVIRENGRSYIVVIKDEYCTRLGGYARICMRKADV